MTEQTRTNPALVAVLKEIVAREDGAILSNRRRLIGLLRDKLPEETRAIRMALTAYDAGVPARLRAHPSLGDVEVAQESHRLSNDTGLSDSFARSAVVAWAQALTDYTPQEATASSAPATPIPVAPLPPVQAQPALQPLPPQTPAAVQPVPVVPVQPVPQSMPPLPMPPPSVQPLPAAPSLRPLPGAGGPPPPPVQPYTGAHPGGGPLPPADLAAQSLPPSRRGKALKFAALAFVSVGILAVVGLVTGIIQPRQGFGVSESPASGPSTSGPSTPAAPQRQTTSDGTMLIGGGRYPTIQTQHEAGNILTFKFATADGGGTSYAAAIHYQGTDGGTGAIVAVHDGQTASTGNVPLQRWVKGSDQNVVVSGRLTNNAGNVTPVCVFATLSANTQVPEIAPGKSFCAYKVNPDGQCAISNADYLGCANLK